MTVIKKILSIKFVCASLLIPGLTHAQTSSSYFAERQVTASCGISINIKNLSQLDKEGLDLDCTVGEPVVKSLPNPDLGIMLTQGFQQPPLQGRINDTNLDDMIIWPNPVGDEELSVRYTLDPNVTKIDVRVISTGGHIMYTETIVVGNDNREWLYKMDCSPFIPGIYLISIIMDTGIKVTKKFVKYDSQ